MKKKDCMKMILAAVVSLFISHAIQAQTSPVHPAESHYWVVENNKTGSIIRVYDYQHNEIYRELVKGKPINTKNKKVKSRLDVMANAIGESKVYALKYKK